MIIQKEKVSVTISNNASYYRERGYGNYKQGNTILVDMKDLPLQSNKKVLAKCDDCEQEFFREYQLLMRSNEHRCKRCARIYIGNNFSEEIRKNFSERAKKQIGSKHPRWNPNKSEFEQYSRKVRWLSEKNYERYKDLINPNDYPRTLCGVKDGYQLDHKISIKESFDTKISVEDVASVTNLQMMRWKDNRSKGAK